MILLGVAVDYFASIGRVELPNSNIVIDPRPIPSYVNFHISVGENNITARREAGSKNRNRGCTLKFRAYDSSREEVPSFDSTTYTYHGLDGERAPANTTIGIIHPSVQIIKKKAFIRCRNMVKCTMNDNVRRIENQAFFGCQSVKGFSLSRNLKQIGKLAFANCETVEDIFIPHGVTNIGKRAFARCRRLKRLHFPPTLRLQQIGDGVIHGCDTLLRGNGIISSRISGGISENEFLDVTCNCLPFLRLSQGRMFTEVHMDTYRNMVAHPAMEERVLLPISFHILAINPFVMVDTIVECLARATFTCAMDSDALDDFLDHMGKHNVEGLLHVINALCIFRNGNREYS